MTDRPRAEVRIMTPKEKNATPFSYVQVEEQKRLNDAREEGIPWKKWGPYLSEAVGDGA